MMEVLVLIDFEGSMSDELTVKMGDVVKNVTKASEEGWLMGELDGKRGIFPSNFVKEIPAYLMGDSKREPRSLRKTLKKNPQMRKCEVTFAYNPVNHDELQLSVGEIIEIVREIEDGWWMGVKNGKVGAFPSNFVSEIFVSPKEEKHNEGKSRPKLANVFSREASVRSKGKALTECCQVMFDYQAKTEDELNLKKGDIIVILNKETEDEGWWEGELNGHRGFFPDNFVMVIPPKDILQAGTTTQLPARSFKQKSLARAELKALMTVPHVKAEASAMENGSPAKTKEDKQDNKDLRSNPPTKVKLPFIPKPSPPPVKDKPNKVLPKTSDDAAPEVKASDKFDGVEFETEKLTHPTANRAKPPQRRPPSGLITATQVSATDPTEPESGPKFQTDRLPALPKTFENLLPSPSKPVDQPKTPPPSRPPAPKVVVDGRPVVKTEEPTLETLQAEIKELRMALDLLQGQHEQDIKELKEELSEERSKRTALQAEVHSLRMKY